MVKVIIMILGASLSVQARAFTCYLTMVKDSCWINYNVSVTVTDANNLKKVMTVKVPQGQAWARQKFSCTTRESLLFNAAFTPVFWKADLGKTYPARHNWGLPETMEKGKTAWNITVCFKRDFSEVPFPPDATGDCVCDTKNIPEIKL